MAQSSFRTEIAETCVDAGCLELARMLLDDATTEEAISQQIAAIRMHADDACKSRRMDNAKKTTD